MNAAFHIARRYLFAKKSHNAIHIISVISVVGVAVGAMALIVVLSVFNGFEQLIQRSFSAFDPDLKVIPREGKSFLIDQSQIDQLLAIPGVLNYAEVVEENALLRYEDYQYVATVKGVSPRYSEMTGIHHMLSDGEFLLHQNNINYTVIGMGVAYYLNVGLSFVSPIAMYAPKRDAVNPHDAFNRKVAFPSGIFIIERDTDARYVLVDIAFARSLFDYDEAITALEIQLAEDVSVKRVQQAVADLLGAELEVQNRFQQKAFFYKIMRTEKWSIFVILAFILIIASFNIMGSLTMLIIEKKRDLWTLSAMGASQRFIRRIFLYEGWMISFIGALTGLLLGTAICLVQEHFGLIKLHGGQSFIVTAYPVHMQWGDFFAVFGMVALIGFFASYYPVRFITRKHIVNIL